jgi:hypothetical protein
MESILFERVKFDLSEQKRVFQKVFGLVAEKMQDAAFTRFTPDGEPTGRLAPAYYEATVCAFASQFAFIQPLDPAVVRQKLIRAYADERFLSSTGPGANSIAKLEERIQVVADYFAST